METIKEEKKADLEQLLNSLIEKGWKPFGNEFARVYVLRDRINKWDFALHFEYEQNGTTRTTFRGRRQLVSKESWLWQFVCENELVKPVVDIISICSYSHFTDDHEDCGWDETFPEYRLIESALKDESELEDFLISNIKVDE